MTENETIKPPPPIMPSNHPTRNKIALVLVIIFAIVLIWQFYKVIHNFGDTTLSISQTGDNTTNNTIMPLMDSSTTKMLDDQLKSINVRTSMPDVTSNNPGGE